jgi:integrase
MAVPRLPLRQHTLTPSHRSHATMPGRRAKLLSERQLMAALRRVAHGRYPDRCRLMLLLSTKAGLRAGEIARLTWPMLLDARGHLAPVIELPDAVAKKGSGRTIPMHPEIRRVLLRLGREGERTGPVLRSERGGPLRSGSVVNWFAALFRELGLEGCSSHSGRRTFITNAARRVHRVGGSLRDVQELAGHRSIQVTQGYIDGDTAVKRRLVRLL